MKGLKLVLLMGVCFFTFQSLSFAVPPVSETIGGITRQQEDLEKSISLRSQIESKTTAEKKAAKEDVVMPDAGPKVLITKITVEGADALPAFDVRQIIAKHEGTEISLKQAQGIADQISGLYRAKGLLTSRAYLPPQSLKEGTLLIKAIEGRVGAVEVRGNRYFKESLLKNRLNMPSGTYFDYSALQNSLVYINEHPDRNAKASLVPGQTAGTTDVILDVKDQLPVHVGFEYDNFGSRYINKSRYATTLEHNNITGHDDKLFYKFQMSEADHMRMQQGSYNLPLSSTANVGAYFVDSKLKLGKEYEDLESRGKARIYGLTFNKALVQKTDLDIRYNLGFDHKSIVNFLSGSMTSRDELRVLKNGVDFDFTDNFGRNILSLEYDAGFPDIMGGMASKDAMASRAGAGAKFQKGLLTFYRLHPTPLETTLLWKNSAQLSNHTLPASEQFQIGGPSSVRGYTPAEASGDKGYYTSMELSLPLYGLSRDVKVPFRQESLRDALKLVTFWDYASVNVKNAAAGEKDTTTLKGYGFGTRFNIKDLSMRVEVGYPIGKTPADGRHAHPWVEFMYKL